MKKPIIDSLKSEIIYMLIENTPIAYIILDENYRIHYINKKFLDLRKLDYESTIGEVCYNISNRGNPCNDCAVRHVFETGEKTFISRKDILPNKAVRFIDDYAIPLQENENGKTKFVLEIMIDRTKEMLLREQYNKDYAEILAILSALIDAKDPYTARHSENVRKLSVKLAKKMNLSEKEILDISIGASLHDIGKIKIPSSILNKPEVLTNEEFELIKKHPVISYEMTKNLSSFDNVKNIVRQHQERIDGKGYPDALTGNEICLGAKIVAIADTYDAIVSARPYKKPLSHEHALKEIERVCATQLDEEIAKIFINMNFEDQESESEAEKPSYIERSIEEKKFNIEEPMKINSDYLSYTLDKEKLFNKILEYTPCGYLLMDAERTVLFASKYFLDYIGISEEALIDKKCYEVIGKNSSSCPFKNCSVGKALISGEIECSRIEINTRNGMKIFDQFGMPIMDILGKIEYVIEVIIDRTDEIQIELNREQDYINMIDMMNDLLEEIEEELHLELSSHIINLRLRLKELVDKPKSFSI